MSAIMISKETIITIEDVEKNAEISRRRWNNKFSQILRKESCIQWNMIHAIWNHIRLSNYIQYQIKNTENYNLRQNDRVIYLSWYLRGWYSMFFPNWASRWTATRTVTTYSHSSFLHQRYKIMSQPRRVEWYGCGIPSCF